MYAVFLRNTVMGRVSPLYKTKKHAQEYIEKRLVKKHPNVSVRHYVIKETLI